MRKKTQVSLKQIAEATDLSITTVSRVLRQQGEISDETRKRVLKVARELNYRPNLLIQGIQTGRTGNVGVMVPPYNPYWAEILKGIHDELVENDYAPVALWDESILAHDNREEFMLKQMHRLIDRRVDGVILWPKVSEVYGAHLDELESRELPVVTIDHELEFADSVVTDEQLGAELVARHLYSQGHVISAIWPVIRTGPGPSSDAPILKRASGNTPMRPASPWWVRMMRTRCPASLGCC